MKKYWDKLIKFLRDPATQTIITIVALFTTITWGAIAGWLNSVTNWLIQNSLIPNWAVLILSIVVILYISQLIKANPQKRLITSKTTQISQVKTPDTDTYSTRPKAAEIIDQLHQALPYQRNSIQKSYEGQKIKWRLLFNNIVDIENDIAWLQLMVKDSMANIYIHADIKKHPKIKIISEGDVLFIEGEIEKLTDYSTIWLINTSIKFDGEQ